MARILTNIAALLALSWSCAAGPIFFGLNNISAPACSGDNLLAGASERFESGGGAGGLCLTNWTRVSTSRQTFATDQYVGSSGHSLKINQGGTYADSYIWTTNTSSTNFTYSFYVRVADVGLTDGQVIRLLEVDNESTFGGTSPCAIEIRRNTGGSASFRLVGSTTTSASISVNTTYRVAFQFQSSGVASGCNMNFYTIGNPTPTSLTAVTANSASAQTHVAIGFVPGTGTGFDSTQMWVDNIKYDATGANFPLSADE